MIYFVVAMRAEASPIIEAYKMKKSMENHPFELFVGAESRLIISGVGFVHASTVCAYLAATFKPSPHDIMVNIGVCGTHDHMIPKGELFLCNKIIDSMTSRAFYPDLLFAHAFREGTLMSAASVVTSPPVGCTEATLFDMEGAYVWQTATCFFPSHAIFVFKVVSDFLATEGVTKESVQRLLQERIHKVQRWLTAVQAHPCTDTFAFNEREQSLIDVVRTNLALTDTMHHEFLSLCRTFTIRNETSVCAVLAPYVNIKTNTRERSKQAYRGLKELLQREPTICPPNHDKGMNPSDRPSAENNQNP